MSYTKKEIEVAFNQLTKEVKSRMSGGGTNKQDVLQFLYENPQKIWWMSWELNDVELKSGKHISHKGSARASDLAIFDSMLVEDRKISRFKAYRLRTENLTLIKKALGTEEAQPSERQKMKVNIVNKCEHGLPSFVTCPNCLSKQTEATAEEVNFFYKH